MPTLGMKPIDHPRPLRAITPVMVVVILGSLLVHLVLLGVLRWPAPVGLEVVNIVTLDLRRAGPVPERAPVPEAAPDTSVSLTRPVAAPASVDLPMPELPGAPVTKGVVGSGGAGLGVRVQPAIDPQIQVGPLRIGARRVVFMVDVSSSMRGSFRDGMTLGDVAAQAVCTALEGLPESVQFRLMCFSGGLSEPLGGQWRWKQDAELACVAIEQVTSQASGLTRSSSLFDPGGLSDAGADAVVLVTDGGILDLEAGALQRWIDLAPSVQLDVVLIGTLLTPTETQRRLAKLARSTGGGVHRLMGSTRP